MTVLEQGQIQIHTENIFPIIKKAVYSGHEVFLRELVSNGVDAISKRRMASMGGDCSEGPEAAISIRINREANTLTISDNGIGMTAEEVRVAMTPFGQVDSGRTRWREGTGLGLPIAKSLVELHNATLEIASEKNRGTQIIMVFPLQMPTDTAAEPSRRSVQ